jgi:demethylmenaquinone methyltransferase/2-methoxy-6-polyprenyl-1,4-benzoquinol methylase
VPQPTAITLHQASRVLEIGFDDGHVFRLPCEYLRVYSPSAEVRGHGPGQEVLQVGKRDVGITAIESVGHYALRPSFSDGHDSGIYSWDYPTTSACASRNCGSATSRASPTPARRATRHEDGNERAGPPQARISPEARSAEGRPMSERTHFGYEQVAPDEKTRRVRGVFDSVASKYDVMNDLMSGGLHRLWKRFAVDVSGVREGGRVLDLAGGTGDMARLYAKAVGASGVVVLTDINGAMLAAGRDKLADAGLVLPVVQCDAEALPFADRHFDCVSIAFGLRNVTRKERALAEMRRVTRPGGVALVLEFSRIAAPLAPAYDWYSFNVLPRLGQWVAGDAASYRYLAESIRMHPDQATLATMMEGAGFDRVEVHNLAAGAVAVHVGRVF